MPRREPEAVHDTEIGCKRRPLALVIRQETNTRARQLHPTECGNEPLTNRSRNERTNRRAAGKRYMQTPTANRQKNPLPIEQHELPLRLSDRPMQRDDERIKATPTTLADAEPP